MVGFRADSLDFANRLTEPKKVKLTETMLDYLDTEIPNKYYLPEKGFKRVIDPKQIKHVSLNGTISRCQVACQQFNWFETCVLNHQFQNVLKKMIGFIKVNTRDKGELHVV